MLGVVLSITAHGAVTLPQHCRRSDDMNALKQAKQTPILERLDITVRTLDDAAVTADRVDAGALWGRRLAGNARRVAETLRSYGPRTRAEIVSLTGLSRPTVTAGLADLRRRRAGHRGDRGHQPAGRRAPASILRLSRGAGLAVGVDIGRRHIRIAVSDLGHVALAERAVRLARDADDHPTEVLDRAAGLVDEALRASGATRADVTGVGVGIPAPITRLGHIGSPALLPAWADLSPVDELGSRLDLPVRLENDANLGALAEYVWGAGRGCADLVYVKLATGIGAGIVLDGRLYRGASGTAGELGHVTLDARGRSAGAATGAASNWSPAVGRCSNTPG
jgi:hypothetical protein